MQQHLTKNQFPPRHDILSVGVDSLSLREALALLAKWSEDNQARYIATANAEMVMRARKDIQLAKVLHEADLVVPDGAGIIWAGEHLSAHFAERVAGIDLMIATIRYAQEKNFPFYLLGGAPGVAHQAVRQMQAKWGTLPVAGVRNGFFLPEESPQLVAEIQESGAKFLFVALGVPKQEFWIHENLSALPGITAMGVGGSLDVISGNLRRAPLWMQKNRLEWLYRLCLQPQRAGRMMVLPQFMWQVWSEKRRRKKALQRGGKQ